MKLYNISKPLIYEGSLTKHDPTFKSVMDLLHLAPVLGLAVPDALPFFLIGWSNIFNYSWVSKFTSCLISRNCSLSLHCHIFVCQIFYFIGFGMFCLESLLSIIVIQVGFMFLPYDVYASCIIISLILEENCSEILLFWTCGNTASIHVLPWKWKSCWDEARGGPWCYEECLLIERPRWLEETGCDNG